MSEHRQFSDTVVGKSPNSFGADLSLSELNKFFSSTGKGGMMRSEPFGNLGVFQFARVVKKEDSQHVTVTVDPFELEEVRMDVKNIWRFPPSLEEFLGRMGELSMCPFEAKVAVDSVQQFLSDINVRVWEYGICCLARARIVSKITSVSLSDCECEVVPCTCRREIRGIRRLLSTCKSGFDGRGWALGGYQERKYLSDSF